MNKFTTPCFIRKNTSELRKKLEKLGYKCSITFDNNQNFIWTSETYYYSTNNNMLGCHYGERMLPYGIYCGTNEQLFLALAALRDDSDFGQWFVHKNGAHWNKVTDKDMTFVEDFNTSNEDVELEAEDFHKATPEELIEYFKENNYDKRPTRPCLGVLA